MANIRKSFNFSSGVQVDNDNFVVSPVGLVGIGTSVPTVGYKLDVRGNIRSTGLTTTQDLNVSRDVEISGITTVGILTASSIDVANGVNVGGALTALTLKLSNGETVDNLIGFARTTFITDNAGVGLHTTSKIGINTTTSPGASDSALEVFGDVNVTGIVTATTFDGALSGDVTGNVTGNVNASSGVSTFTELKVGTAITMSAGIVTATTFDGALTGDVTGNVTGNVNASSGVSTFTELKVGTAITMSAGIVTATKFIGNLTGDVTGGSVNAASGISTFTELKVGTAITMSAGIVTATTIDVSSVNSTGVINSNTRLVAPSVGIGTSLPNAGLHIRKSGISSLRLSSDNDYSVITFGKSVGNVPSDDGQIRYGYGNALGDAQFSTGQSLDIINYGTDNLNFYLNPSGVGTAFNWLTDPITRAMVLTRDGNLGINSTSPSEKLSVGGGATFTGNVFSEGNITGNTIVKIGGASNQFLKADGSVTTGTFLSAGDNGSSLTGIITTILGGSGINVTEESGTATITRGSVYDGLSVDNQLIVTDDGAVSTSCTITENKLIFNSPTGLGGTITAPGGFTSGTGDPVRISVVGTTLTFNVVGVGSTSLTLL